jgi:hypothetical protein
MGELSMRFSCSKETRGDEFFRKGKKGNPVAVMFERPTEAACELRRPLIGRTQVNLCRLFERLKAIDEKNYKKFCVDDVLVLNAYSSYDKKSKEGDDIFAIENRRMCIKQKRVVLCFGNAACMAYRKIAEGDRLFGSNKVVIQLCHFSDRGISNFFGKIGKGRKLVFSEKLNLVAWYVNSCYGKGGFFSIDKFYQAVSPLIQSEIMEGKEFDIAWLMQSKREGVTQ